MAGRPGKSFKPVEHPPRTDQRPRLGSRPKIVKLGSAVGDAILLIMQYVAQTTGIEPSQEEIAAVFKSYFTLNEVSNQIKYLRKKPADGEDKDTFSSSLCVSLRINLVSKPPKNSLARAGYFIPSIGEGIAAIRKHAKAMHGVEPSEVEVIRSLKSSFILSELKNQIVHLRRQSR